MWARSKFYSLWCRSAWNTEWPISWNWCAPRQLRRTRECWSVGRNSRWLSSGESSRRRGTQSRESFRRWALGVSLRRKTSKVVVVWSWEFDLLILLERCSQSRTPNRSPYQHRLRKHIWQKQRQLTDLQARIALHTTGSWSGAHR